MTSFPDDNMRVLHSDFNGADQFFATDAGASEWSDVQRILRGMPLYMQASDQRGKKGKPIFDPKATNAHLNRATQECGWAPIPVPDDLTEFGTDWDGGKRSTLAEWQFSNYPFLWNNIIRTEAVFNAKTRLPGLMAIRGLIVVTKCGLFPASNSTLYYEQAKAQLEAATRFGAFSIPIRLVGLSISTGPTSQAIWSIYSGRYARKPESQETVTMRVKRTGKGKYGAQRVTFTRVTT
jgi:hypothetical protein